MIRGTGPGAITADGCAVELYRRLPPLGEAEVVHAEIPAKSRVLDLGCGTGRIARALVALGHHVVGVDQDADMLGHASDIETVCAPIAGLRLGQTFDVVLLASHLLNTPVDEERLALLETATRHLAPRSAVVAQWHPPAWFDTVAVGDGGPVGNVLVEVVDVTRAGDRLHATVRYTLDGSLLDEAVWTQSFTVGRLTDQGLRRDLRAAGRCFARWCSRPDWFVAMREESPMTDGRLRPNADA